MLLVGLETCSLFQRLTYRDKEQIRARKKLFRISSWEIVSIIFPVRSARYRDRNLKFIAKNSAPFENMIETTFWIKSFHLQKCKHYIQKFIYFKNIQILFSNIFENGKKMAEMCNDMQRN